MIIFVLPIFLINKLKFIGIKYVDSLINNKIKR